MNVCIASAIKILLASLAHIFSKEKRKKPEKKEKRKPLNRRGDVFCQGFCHFI
jgi:hypothetical protein